MGWGSGSLPCIAYEVKDAPRHFGNHIIPESFVGCRNMLRAILMVMSISWTLPTRNPIVRPCNMYRSYIYTQHDVTILEWIHTRNRIEVPSKFGNCTEIEFPNFQKKLHGEEASSTPYRETLLYGRNRRKTHKKPNHQVIQSDPIFSLGGISLV